MELKKGFFLNIQGQGQLIMQKNEDILAWVTRIKWCLLSLVLDDVFLKVIAVIPQQLANNMLHQIPEHNIDSAHTCTVSYLHAWAYLFKFIDINN